MGYRAKHSNQFYIKVTGKLNVHKHVQVKHGNDDDLVDDEDNNEIT